MGTDIAASPGNSSPRSEGSSARARPPIGRLHLLAVMLGLISLGGFNFVLLKILYTAYGDRRAFFVNQAINLLYILYGGAVLYPRMFAPKSVITPEMRKFPKKPFMIMGFLDSLGTFFTCLGATYTPGSLTPLLNQLLIPFTMLVTAVYLRIRPSWKEAAGATLIALGACTSVAPRLLTASEVSESASTDIRWYAVGFYALSNLPMAMSACYKEATFDENTLDVWYLTQWVSIFQFLVSFLYMPLMALPGFGSQDGMPLSEVPEAFSEGLSCYLEQVPECVEFRGFLLLTGYCGVNVCFNTLGLYLTKHGSAVLNSLSYSVLLPFTTTLFFLPVLGQYQEPFTRNSVYTFWGLGVAWLGFGIYQGVAQNVGEAEVPQGGEAGEALQTPLLLVAQVVPAHGQPSFQERAIGLDQTYGRYESVKHYNSN